MHSRSIFAMAAILLALMVLQGCTVNPQDLSAQPKPGVGLAGANGTGDGSAPSAITLSVQEIAKHNTEADCWVYINDAVLDLSSFTAHPGGMAYAPYCGTNATEAFYNVPGKGGHSAYALGWMKDFEIGVVGGQVQAGQRGGSADSNVTAGEAGFTGGTGVRNNGSWGNLTLLTAEEVAKHSAESDCWAIFWNDVLDLSAFTKHPGGAAYTSYCGGDGTSAFEAIGHSSKAYALMADYKIGEIGQSVDIANTTAANPRNATKFEDDDEWEEEDD
ncbi:MAG: cytochrome b5 domain-containing protein [Candidatus Micrarchaeia archaeon]